MLALTFTNKAAGEMKTRIADLVGPASRALWMGTFHSLLARMLRFECEPLGYGRNFSIYDTDESLSLIKGIMNDLGVSQQQFTPSGIRSRISNAKNAMVTPAELQRRARGHPGPSVPRISSWNTNARLKRANAMDFDDLLLKPLELFRTHKDVLKRYQQRFQYILVDEYQDTNRVQYLLLRELAAGAQEYLHRRRRCAEHLLVPRRRYPEHPRFPEGLPRLQGLPARAELPVHEDHPRRRRFADPPQCGSDQEDALDEQCRRGPGGGGCVR